MSTLSERDQKLFKDLRAFGVLEDIDGGRLDQTSGIFVVACSDCDQFDDIYTLHKALMLKQRRTARPHMFADHGKPLWIAENSPLNTNGRGANLLKSIGEVPGIKEINTGVFHPHAPCAAATRAGLDFVHQVAIVKASKALAQRTYPNLTIANFFQVDNGKKRSYRVNGEQWRNYLVSKGYTREALLNPKQLLITLLNDPIPI